MKLKIAKLTKDSQVIRLVCVQKNGCLTLFWVDLRHLGAYLMRNRQ
jgi:hypothetical protein